MIGSSVDRTRPRTGLWARRASARIRRRLIAGRRGS